MKSTTDLARPVLNRPQSDLRNRDTHLLLLLNALESLTESGDYCHNRMDLVVRNDLNLEPSTGDPALYYDTSNDISFLEGLCVTQVDDILGTCSTEFYNRSLGLARTFDSNPLDTPPLNLCPYTDRPLNQ